MEEEVKIGLTSALFSQYPLQVLQAYKYLCRVNCSFSLDQRGGFPSVGGFNLTDLENDGANLPPVDSKQSLFADARTTTSSRSTGLSSFDSSNISDTSSSPHERNTIGSRSSFEWPWLNSQLDQPSGDSTDSYSIPSPNVSNVLSFIVSPMFIIYFLIHLFHQDDEV